MLNEGDVIIYFWILQLSQKNHETFKKPQSNDEKIYYLVYWSRIEDTYWAMFLVQTSYTLYSNIQEYLSNMSYWCHKSMQHPPMVPPTVFS